MKLLNEELINFRSHTNSFLDFTRFDSAVVVGENGVGKSSFAYGLCYCFWGDIEGLKIAELVYTNALNMSVAVGFIHDDGNIYRIVRGVTVTGKKKKTFTGHLSLLQQDPNGMIEAPDGNTYTDISGNSMADTTKEITKLLGGLKAKTAIYSNFDLQGESERFMKALPSERRKLFEEILNLQMYEKLEKAARSEVRDARIALQALDIDDIKEKELELKIKTLETETTTLKAGGNDLQVVIDEVTKRTHSLETVIKNDTTDLIKKKTPLEEDLQKNAEQIKATENKLQDFDKILADKENIMAQNEALQSKISALKDAQDARQAYTVAKGERKSVAGSFSYAESRLQRAQANLENKTKVLAMEEATLREKFSLDENNPDLLLWMEETAESIKAEKAHNLVLLANEEKELDTLIKRKTELLSRIAVIETTQKTMNAQIKKIETAGAMCPVFNKPCEKLTQEQRDIELAEINTQLSDINSEYVALNEEKTVVIASINNLNTSISAKQGMEKTYERKTLTLSNDTANYTKLQASTSDEIAALKAEMLKEQATIADLDKELDKIDKTIIDTGFNPDEYKQLEEDIKKLENEKWDEKRDKLLTAEASIEDLQSRLKEYKERSDSLTALIESVSNEIKEREKELAQANLDLDSAKAVLRDNKAKLGELNSKLTEVAKELGISQTLLNQMREQKNKSLEFKQKMQDYSALEKSYKKVRALIVENSVPKFQEMCNEVLDYLEVKIRVRIETLEEGKDSKTKEIKLTPTFKIIVIDGNDGSERDYSTWSGGEKQRINLAIRQALSTILLNRAGTKMDLIIIDESDSALDDEGKTAMIKLIQANVEGRFGKPAKVLCITHTSELKDSFPTRITVKKKKKASYIAEIQ